MINLKNKNIILTGATGGIGHSIVDTLVALDANVLVTGTNEQKLEELKKKYKVNVYFPVTPFVENAELRQLYEQGVISWKSYGEYALRNISLPIDDLQPKAPPCDALLFEKPVEPAPAAPAPKPTAQPDDKKRKADNSSDTKDTKKPKEKE